MVVEPYQNTIFLLMPSYVQEGCIQWEVKQMKASNDFTSIMKLLGVESNVRYLFNYNKSKKLRKNKRMVVK